MPIALYTATRTYPSEITLSNPEKQIAHAVNLETQAYDEQDIDALVGVHHPDRVSLWPPTPHSHDPIEWVMGLGRFDPQRWADSWRKYLLPTV
jgi:hypothetical protein